MLSAIDRLKLVIGATLLPSWREAIAIQPDLIAAIASREPVDVGRGLVPRRGRIAAGHKAPPYGIMASGQRRDTILRWHRAGFRLFWRSRSRPRSAAVLLLIEDDYSRYLPGWALCEGERAEAVIEAVEAAIARHGKPEQMVVEPEEPVGSG